MAGLDDLMTFLAIDQAKQKSIAEADPYIGGANIADSLGQAIVSSGPNFSTRDKMIGGLLTGFLGGAATGASADYRSRAEKSFQDVVLGGLGGQQVERPSVLSSGLFGQAQNQSNLFKINRTLQLADAANKMQMEGQLAELKGQQDLKNEVAKEIIKNPRRMNQLAPVIESLFGRRPEAGVMPGAVQALAAPTESEIISGVDADRSGLDLALGGESPAAAVSAPPAAEEQAVAAFKRSTPEDEAIATYNRIFDATGDDAYAKTAAERAQEAAIKRGEEESKYLAEQSASLMNSKRIMAELDAAIEGAGTTGNVWPFEESIRGFTVGAQADTGVPGADIRQGARKNLNALGVDFAGQIRKAFPGQVSEREFLKYLEMAPGTDKTIPENKALANRMRRMSQAAEASNAFVNKQLSKGRTIGEAMALYTELDEAVPLFVPDQSGNPTINPARLNLSSQVDQTAKETAQLQAETPATDSALQNVGKVGKSFVQGVAKTPQAIGAIFSPSTYKQAFSGPETAARTVGTGAAMMAGGALGAKSGAVIGAFGGPFAPITVPVGTVLGGAIGSGLGYLGFGSAEEAASEAAGVGTDRPVVPGMKEIQEASEIAGQGLGVGGVVKGVQTVGKGIGAIAKGTAGLADDAAQSAKSNLIGVKPADLRKAVKNNAAQYVDDAGNEVALKDATTYQSKVEQALKAVDDDGVFAAAKNDPKAMRVEFDKKARVAAQEISDLHNSTDAALKQIHSQLPKIQQKQFPLERDPLTGKGGFLPNKQDFAPVFDRIREIGKTDPQMVPALTKRANSVINSWNKTSRSYNAMQDRKSLLGKSAKWGKGTTAVTDAWNLVKQDFNRVFADAQNSAFEFAAQQANPALSGALKAANSKFAAYKTLEPIMKAKGASGTPPIEIGTLGSGLPGSIWRRSPATALGISEKAALVAKAPLKGYDALTRQRGSVSPQFIDDAAALAGSGARLIGKNARVLPGALSPQDDIDLAMSQARANMPSAQPVPTPQPVETAAMPVNPIVSEFEGGQQLKAYPPPARGSGVTVATGIDLGQRSLAELKDLGISEPLIKKVTPYLGKKDADASGLLKKSPLKLTQDEADELDSAIGGKIAQEISLKYSDATGQDLAALPEPARVVVESLAYNFGPNLDKKIPTIWNAIVSGDWATVQDKLRTTKWKQPELADRRNREADILSEIV
jgi:hypothetical protein